MQELLLLQKNNMATQKKQISEETKAIIAKIRGPKIDKEASEKARQERKKNKWTLSGNRLILQTTGRVHWKNSIFF